MFATVLGVSGPSLAAAQQPSADSLLRRIAYLERRVSELERRVIQLESPARGESSRVPPVPGSPSWRDIANWRRLSRGMTTEEVRAMLGEPDRVNAIEIVTTWTWGAYPNSGDVTFTNGKVSSWSEPRR